MKTMPTSFPGIAWIDPLILLIFVFPVSTSVLICKINKKEPPVYSFALQINYSYPTSIMQIFQFWIINLLTYEDWHLELLIRCRNRDEHEKFFRCFNLMIYSLGSISIDCGSYCLHCCNNHISNVISFYVFLSSLPVENFFTTTFV